jgi:hypothetical protein
MMQLLADCSVPYTYTRKRNGKKNEMKALLRSLFLFTMFLLSIIVGIPLGIIVIVFSYFTISNKCDFYTVDSLPSPKGELFVARVEKRCTRDHDTPPMMFALLHPGEQLGSRSMFLTSADYEGIGNGEYLGAGPPLSVFAKWIDERNLVVAAPEGSALKKGRNNFRGVHIQYSFYPTGSDKTKDEYLRRQIEKSVRFEPRFRMDDGIGVPGIGCLLDLTAYDGQYMDQLSLSMVARTIFPVKSNRGLEEAYSVYGFQIVARDEIQRPDKHATGAEVIGFAPKDGRSKLWISDFNYPGTRAPSGVPAPKWDFGYNPKDPHDIMSIAEKTKDGTVAIRVSFWLDNEVVVYSGEKRTDQKPIEMFEQCIKENRIFDTPRHRTDRH